MKKQSRIMKVSKGIHWLGSICFYIVFSIVLTFFARPFDVQADTITMPGSLGFDTAQGSTVNIDQDNLDLVIQMGCGTDGEECACVDGVCSNEGDWYRSSTSNAGCGEYLFHLSKDLETGWSGDDECVPQYISDGFYDGVYLHPDVLHVNGHEYRTGPQIGATGVATLPIPYSISPPSPDLTAIRFLTGASYGFSIGSCSGDAIYTVTWSYDGATPDIEVEVRIKSFCNSDRRSGDLALDGWEVFAGESYTGLCWYDSSNVSYLDEVIVTNPDIGGMVSSVEISYSPLSSGDLRGPIAVAFEVDQFTYDSLTHHEGSYSTANTALSSTENAIWYGVEWDWTIDDHGANPIPFGDIFLTLGCGDGSPGGWIIGGFYSNTTEDSDSMVYPFDIGGGAYCSGTHGSFELNLDAYLGHSPSLDSLTFYYDIDFDGDGYGATGYKADGSTPPGLPGTPDCDDHNAAIYPGATEICSDGIDQDCDGGDTLCVEDEDNDGDGYSSNAGDCDDDNAGINPGAKEIPFPLNSVDENCNGNLFCFISTLMN